MTQAAYTHNGQNISAEAFYAIACDPRRSVAVEACAGAGKTWMLVSRMLRALLEVDSNGHTPQAHEILAITFTKKAAGEMRERLQEWLQNFAHASDAVLQQELQWRGVSNQMGPEPAQRMREALSNLYARMLAQGRPVQIRTFHSWFAALLRSAPVATLQQLGLPVNYELLEDDAPAKALVWQRFYVALLANAPLKADFESVVMAHGRFQTGKALQGALDKRTEFALADEAGVLGSSVAHFGAQFSEFAGLTDPKDVLDASPEPNEFTALFSRAAVALGRASAPTFSAKGAELERALTGGDLPGALAALLTGTGTPRKFSEKITDLATVRLAQDAALRITAAISQHTAWDYQQRMSRLSRLLLAEFTALKRERGWVDMNDVEMAALTMLSDEVLSGWVQERLDARIRHLMIDEFQDTNPLQWQALSSWLASYGGAGGGSRAPSVFLVGDPKQSIYRFRRAEPQVFMAAQAFVQTALGGDLLACDHTRRNSAAVIRTVNAVMGAAVLADGYEGFRPHTSASQAPGLVEQLPVIARQWAGDDSDASKATGEPAGLWRDSLTTPRELPEETLRTLEARQAAAFIAQRLANDLKPADIMVLSRKRAGLLPLQTELRLLGIAAQIGEKTDLIDCCEVLDVVALLDALVSPQHDLSLARALKSPLFGLSDEALVDIALLKGTSNTSWFDLLLNSEHARNETRRLPAILLQYKAWVDTLPPHDALQAIYAQGDVLARFAAAAPAANRAGVLANLRALLGVALSQGGGRFATPYGFIRALKAGGVQAPQATSPHAVRLLTIHGAKGLEAHTVLLLDTDTAERNADSMSVLIDWPGAAPAPQKFVFLISESNPPACAASALAIEKLARQREELNALYVALTRACNSLVFSSIEPFRAAPASWWQRVQAGAQARAAQVLPQAQAAGLSASGDFYLLELPKLAQLPHSPPLLDTNDSPVEQDSEAARIGKAMHRLLEWSPQVSPGDVDALYTTAQVLGAARQFSLTPEQAERAASMARRIRTGEAAWAWDANALSWQGNEVELLHAGLSLRIDRLVMRKDADHAGQWWVLDYKSAHRPEQQQELIAQMRTYRAALEAIYPNAPVKTAFLTAAGQLLVVD